MSENKEDWYKELKPIIGHLFINNRPAILATKVDLAKALNAVHAEKEKIKRDYNNLKTEVDNQEDAYLSLLKDFTKNKS